MGKKLSEMSLEELWQLFPIFLTEHNKSWKDWFNEEFNNLKEIFLSSVRISHIGSTTVEFIWAKPIIDILVEIPKEWDIKEVKTKIIKLGYICMSEDFNRISFNKGYTENGFQEKVFHLHLRYFGDNEELYFRDYLKENKEVAIEYQNLKLKLWKEFEHNREGYTNAKTEFIKRYTVLAKQKYESRYN